MKKIITLLLMGISSTVLFSQTQLSNLVFFTQNGETFNLSLNGVLKNENPLSNVKANGLNLPRYSVKIDFTDETLGDVNKDVYVQPGYETAISIQKNNKGEYVLRPQSQVAIGQTFAQTPPTNGGAVPVNNNVTYTQTNTRQPNNNTTYTQTTTTQTTNPDVNMNVNMSVPGVNVNVNVSDPTMNNSTTYSQTTTTTTSSSSNYNSNANTQRTYSRCTYPMSSTDFTSAYNSINEKSFDDTKLTVAKQVISANCLKTSQVKQIMLLFSFEDTRLDLAKFAYGQTYDPNNYYQLNDAFTFSSSTDELNTYINGFAR